MNPFSAFLQGAISMAMTFVLFASAQPDKQSTTWPQWRGPSRDGQAAPGHSWPRKLDSAHLNLAWRVELGPSYSGPIVSDDSIFVTETKDKQFEVVRALDRSTGRQLWETSWDGSMSVPFFAKSNGDWIRSTPAFDGECLFVGGMRDVLVCINAKTGAVQWRKDFVQEFGAELPAFGLVCSPLIDDEAVYLQAGAAVCKLEKRSGKILWKSLEDAGGMWGSAFSSPFMAELAGRKQLLVQTREKLASVNPGNGEVLWSHKIPAFRGMNILTPMVAGNSVFTSAYGGKSFLFTLGADGNGKPHLNETWTNNVRGYMSSPVVIDGHLYLHLQNQRFTCIKLQTGEVCWTSKPFGKYCSLVANGDQILALDQRGELLLIQANPKEFLLTDARKISDQDTWAHLAVCDDEIFIRELHAIAVYRWREIK